jgi:hypothetical protein
MIQGEQYILKAGFTSGYGFDGLVVGLLRADRRPGSSPAPCCSAFSAPVV